MRRTKIYRAARRSDGRCRACRIAIEDGHVDAQQEHDGLAEEQEEESRTADPEHFPKGAGVDFGFSFVGVVAGAAEESLGALKEKSGSVVLGQLEIMSSQHVPVMMSWI